MKFDHIGVFVTTLSYGSEEIKTMFNVLSESEVFNDKQMSVSVQFLYDPDDICYEIVAPYGDKSPVDNVISSKKNILNHVAYKVKNFDEKISEYINLRCIPLGKPINAVAFNNARVIFVLSPLGFIIELIEDEENE